jgi:hypothetical protein
VNGEGTAGPSASRAEVRPSPDDRCPECGDPVGHEWVSFRQDPIKSESLVRHFAGVVRAGPIEPEPKRPKRTIRDFRYPEDLDVFFHSWCAPRARLSEEKEKEITELLAKCIVAALEKTAGRWAKVRQPVAGESEPQRVHAQVASVEGRRVFTMARAEWERFRACEGLLIEIDLERTPAGSLAEFASVIVGLLADCPITAERIEVWPYSEKGEPIPFNVQDYLILKNFTRQVNLPKFAERAGTQDSPQLRKHLREHVFIVRQHREKARWHPKPRCLERVVFMSV